MDKISNYENKIEIILKEITDTFSQINRKEVEQLINSIKSAEKVYITGVGRVLLSMQSVIKRFTHVGIEAYYVGQLDEPPATERDILIAASNSGESVIPSGITLKAKSLGLKVVYIGSSPDSTIGKLADIRVMIPVSNKFYQNAVIKSEQPMTSLFEQILLLLGDAIAMVIIDENNIKGINNWNIHANLE
ncbi:MAG: SIS domain-containing protein [Bacteroidales bacterium]|jgi:6-phospho-3-hexuloisomerase|nr:SIS domain-containing protein [Bacteroidales bacterium]